MELGCHLTAQSPAQSPVDPSAHTPVIGAAILRHSKVTALPLHVLKIILRLLLVTPNALPLDSQRHKDVQKAHIATKPDVLRVCRLFYLTGLPILYGENTITTSQSYAFDSYLLSLPPRNRQMITSIRLEIDWADQLWAKFPLIAMQLGQLRHLQKLEIIIVESKTHESCAALLDNDPNRTLFIGHRQLNGMKREGSLSDAMLKAEKKMLKDMVQGLKALRVFKLEGFRDSLFAERLCFEKSVSCK